MWSGVADVAELHLPHISSLVICQITKFTFPERRWPRTFQRNGMDGVEGCISSAWAKSGCYGPISLSFVNPRSEAHLGQELLQHPFNSIIHPQLFHPIRNQSFRKLH